MDASLLFDGGTFVESASGEMGSQLYDLMPEHLPALWAIGLAVVGGIWLMRQGRGPRMEAFRQLPLGVRAVIALLLISGAAHAGMAWGSNGGWRVLFAASAAMAGIILLRIVDGKTWRRWAWLLLAGSLVGYWIELIGGHPADQIGITVKAIEVFALYLVLSPSPDQAATRRLRQAAATVGLVVISVLNATAVWAGAFGSGSGDTNPLDHHSDGSITPGTVINAGKITEISFAQQREADHLWAATAAFTGRYRDLSLAAADGYRVANMAGSDFHAPNPVYQNDGLMLDPTKPENLIYAVGSDGPVLLGVMFETEGLRNEPPPTGGAALDWHRHEQVCFALTPPGLAGLVDPFGNCPVGSLAIPTTNSMMHVWTVEDRVVGNRRR
jgi:hypothetical protein